MNILNVWIVGTWALLSFAPMANFAFLLTFLFVWHRHIPRRFKR